MWLNPTLCLGALGNGDVMQRLSPLVHPYKIAARQISYLPRSTQAHERLESLASCVSEGNDLVTA